jgi:hypothetical protein
LAAGHSLTDLANLVNYSKSHLSKIESGSKTAGVALARRCDQALNASGALARLVRPRTPGGEAPAGDRSGEVWAMRLAANGYNQFHAFDRRTMVASGAATLLSWSTVPPAGGSDGAAVALPDFRAMFDQFRLLGQVVDPATLSQILVGATNALRHLASTAPSNARAAALRLSARFAEYTGWMAQESGDDTAALWWTNQAVDMAAAGGDHELEHYALVRRAEVALYRDDAKSVVALAGRAQAARCSARIRGLAAQREAQGHAIAGDENACRDALDRAGDLLGRAAQESSAEPVLGSSATVDPGRFVTAWCMYDLGHPDAAAEVLAGELDRLPGQAFRLRARYATRLALALASIRQIDQACAAVAPVLDRASLIDSATVRYDLRQLARNLNRWRTDETVRRTMPSLVAALHTNQAQPLRYQQ